MLKDSTDKWEKAMSKILLYTAGKALLGLLFCEAYKYFAQYTPYWFPQDEDAVLVIAI